MQESSIAKLAKEYMKRTLFLLRKQNFRSENDGDEVVVVTDKGEFRFYTSCNRTQVCYQPLHLENTDIALTECGIQVNKHGNKCSWCLCSKDVDGGLHLPTSSLDEAAHEKRNPDSCCA